MGTNSFHCLLSTYCTCRYNRSQTLWVRVVSAHEPWKHDFLLGSQNIKIIVYKKLYVSIFYRRIWWLIRGPPILEPLIYFLHASWPCSVFNKAVRHFRSPPPFFRRLQFKVFVSLVFVVLLDVTCSCLHSAWKYFQSKTSDKRIYSYKHAELPYFFFTKMNSNFVSQIMTMPLKQLENNY